MPHKRQTIEEKTVEIAREVYRYSKERLGPDVSFDDYLRVVRSDGKELSAVDERLWRVLRKPGIDETADELAECVGRGMLLSPGREEAFRTRLRALLRDFDDPSPE